MNDMKEKAPFDFRNFRVVCAAHSKSSTNSAERSRSFTNSLDKISNQAESVCLTDQMNHEIGAIYHIYFEIPLWYMGHKPFEGHSVLKVGQGTIVQWGADKRTCLSRGLALAQL